MKDLCDTLCIPLEEAFENIFWTADYIELDLFQFHLEQWMEEKYEIAKLDTTSQMIISFLALICLKIMMKSLIFHPRQAQKKSITSSETIQTIAATTKLWKSSSPQKTEQISTRTYYNNYGVVHDDELMLIIIIFLGGND